MIMKRTVAVNIYNGRWDILDALRVVELSDQELFEFGENPKAAIAAAANRGRRIVAEPPIVDPIEPIDWNLL